MRRTPARNSAGLAASCARIGKGVGGGGGGGFIGPGRRRLRRGVTENLREGVNRGGLGLRRE
jgi:hypothetical protein